jgi:hypothetical protein
MHDANQDRLMIQKMAYFRVKLRRLPEPYARFLEESLEPGGTVVVLDCRRTWRTTRVGERHVFQHGALGGATDEEYLHGGERVADFLLRERSSRTRWDAPEPDGTMPEAEWGFEPALLGDVGALARRRGWQLRVVSFVEPEHMSPLVADLYRWWYGRRGLPARRLLVASFILLDPWWTFRTGSIPFWTKFPVEDDLQALERYLDERSGFDELNVLLFSHGVDSIGLVPLERWRALLGRVERGRLVGVDEKAFPRDFAIFLRYRRAVSHIPARVPLPDPLSPADFDGFLGESGSRYDVSWS